MPAYVIAEHDVTDAATYDRARPIAAAAIAKHGGRYLVNGLGTTELIEGNVPPRRIVILEFPDMKAARRFYELSEYREAKALRHSASTSRIVLADGVMSTKPGPSR